MLDDTAAASYARTDGEFMKGPAQRTTNALDAHIGKRLAQRRNEIGLDQEGLAARLGVDSSTIEAFETGRQRIDAGLLLVIARELSVPLAHFFEDMASGATLDPERLLEILRRLR